MVIGQTSSIEKEILKKFTPLGGPVDSKGKVLALPSHLTARFLKTEKQFLEMAEYVCEMVPIGTMRENSLTDLLKSREFAISAFTKELEPEPTKVFGEKKKGFFSK